MSVQWVIQVALADAASLAPLRLTRGIEVAEKESFVWARGANSDEKIERLLRALPAIARYEITAGNRLRELESRIPSETLPALNWQPVNAWLRVRMPSSSLTSSHGEREDVAVSVRPVSLRMIRSAEERSIALLLTTLDDWREFALNAPEVRLRQLRFAVDETGNVVIRGKPLPPVRGRQYVLDGNIAVQAGFVWEPGVSAEVLSRRLGLSAEALALFHDDGTFSRIESEQFVPATRSAVRETVAAFTTQ
jgi:hypothetical protein